MIDRSTRVLLISALAISCADLPTLVPGVCGNGVLERDLGEQCDMSEDPKLGPNTRCADPSDTERACRYVCTGSGVACPTAWGCDQNGVCHYASGTFLELEDSPIDVPDFARLNLADIDGDTNADIVTSAPSGISVRFARSDGSYSSSFEFHVQQFARAIAFGDVDMDGRTDILASTPRGPVQLRGQRDRTLEPTIFSQFAFPEGLGMSAKGEPVGVKVSTMRATEDACSPDGYQVVIGIAYASEMNLLFPFFEQAGAIVPEYEDQTQVPNRIYARDLDGDDADELIVALPGASSIRTYKLGCQQGPTGPHLTLQESSVQLPGIIFRRLLDPSDMIDADELATPDLVRFIDVNGDDRSDMLVTIFNPIMRELRIAVLTATEDGFNPPQQIPVPELPLALGYIDQDTRLDIVTASGIHYGGENDTWQKIAGPRRLSANAWTEAVIADLNDDGFPDVAAVSGRAEIYGIELYQSRQFAGEPRSAGTSPSTLIDTLAVPRGLRPADYDGDGIRDIAFAESTLFGGSRLSVLYGGTLERVDMGATGFVAVMETAEFTDDQAADLVLIMLEEVDGALRPSVGLLFGSDEHRLLSPVPLIDVSVGDEIDTFELDPPRVLVGHFDGADQVLDLLVYNHRSFLVAPGNGDGTFVTDEQGPREGGPGGGGGGGAMEERPQGFTLSDIVPEFDYLSIECVHFVGADIDTASEDTELVGISERTCLARQSAQGAREEPIARSLDPQLFIVGTGGGQGPPNIAKLMLPQTIQAITGVLVTNLDGYDASDSHSELIVLHDGGLTQESVSAPKEISIIQGEEPGILIYWNVRASFATSSPVIEHDGISEVKVTSGLKFPRAVVSLNMDDDQRLELVVLIQEILGNSGQASAYTIDFAEDSKTGTLSAAPVVVNTLSTRSEPALASTDVDRDGLHDLIYGDGSQVYIYRSLPHRPEEEMKE